MIMNGISTMSDTIPHLRNAPSHDHEALKRLDMAHHLPAQTDYGLRDQLGGSRFMVSGEGVRLTDAEGKSLIDGMAGLWCVSLGYGRRDLAEVAYQQMSELAYYNTLFKTATPPPVKLAAMISERLNLTRTEDGPDLSHVFFNSSGSEANDTIFRMVRHYWALKGQPERIVFISRHNAYHGSSVASASLGGMKHMHAQGGLPIAGIEHIDQPYGFEARHEGESEDAFAARMAKALEDRILAVGPERVAAFIGEPVQGAGGVIIPPEGYWPRIEAICRKYEILLICDEVITGFGRTGQWFGFQHFGVRPDLVTMAKGITSGYLPLSAVGVSAEIYEVLKGGGEFTHGYTYSGHPVCCAVGIKTLEILKAEDLIDRTLRVTGPALSCALETLADHPLVGEVRCLGLLGAIEIVADKASNARFGDQAGLAGPQVRDIMISRGLMVRAVRDTIVMCPPLIITEAEIAEMAGILRDGLDAALKVLKG